MEKNSRKNTNRQRKRYIMWKNLHKIAAHLQQKKMFKRIALENIHINKLNITKPILPTTYHIKWNVWRGEEMRKTWFAISGGCHINIHTHAQHIDI